MMYQIKKKKMIMMATPKKREMTADEIIRISLNCALHYDAISIQEHAKARKWHNQVTEFFDKISKDSKEGD